MWPLPLTTNPRNTTGLTRFGQPTPRPHQHHHLRPTPLLPIVFPIPLQAEKYPELSNPHDLPLRPTSNFVPAVPGPIILRALQLLWTASAAVNTSMRINQGQYQARVTFPPRARARRSKNCANCASLVSNKTRSPLPPPSSVYQTVQLPKPLSPSLYMSSNLPSLSSVCLLYS